MRFRFTLLPLILLLVAVPAAGADYRVGIGDQNPGMFDQPRFQALGVKRARYLVPWDVFKHRSQLAEADGFLFRARDHGIDVLATFTAPRGCWNGRYSRASRCRAPSARAYEREVKRFRARYPWVRSFAPWNEVNHASQPTYRSPRTAAAYYNVMRRRCTTRCTLLAADVLDSSNVTSYLRTFRRYAKGSPKRWGLHNYSDVNRRRSTGTRRVLRAVPGEVWLTESGGIVRFAPDFPYSESRAADRLRYMFSLADAYDTRRTGMRSRITRVYPYQWTGAKRGARFDAGLVDPDGSPRAGYSVFRTFLARRSR